MSKNHGQWQAQGADIKDPPKGHCKEWGQDSTPTKEEGLGWLAEVAAMCTGSQRKLREKSACPDAKLFVRRAPAGGYPTTSKHFYARSGTYRNARIDLEVYGMAFRDEEDPK